MSWGRPYEDDERDYYEAYAELETEDEAYADNFSIEESLSAEDDREWQVGCVDAVQAETPPRAPVRVDLEARVVDAVLYGDRRMLILAAIGQPEPPLYVYPPAAIEGDVLELYADGERLFDDSVLKVTKTQALSMERHGDLAWSHCGRDLAAFQLYSAEELALTKMDGWFDDAARFLHYCQDGKRFNGHAVWWEPAALESQR